MAALWRYNPIFRVDACPSFRNVEVLGLWESPTGMYFFEPRLEGDHDFYTTLYRHIGAGEPRGKKRQKGWRLEYDIAGTYVRAGDKVLDYGCGFGGFRYAINNASYTGLDPNFADRDASGKIRNESIGDHLRTAAGAYDVVCCFQVLEHLADPSGLFKELVRAARPGGRIIVGVPQVPSAMTRTPNFVFNAPPHHLTWWTKPALMELARRSGAEPEYIEPVPWSSADAQSYWIERYSLIKSHDTYFKGDWWWHAASVVSWCAGLLAYYILPTPKGGAPGDYVNILMVARKLDSSG
ncbi:MAG: class I SAM-dependent methyltransferase [Methylobacteriaceae bacterium]|nr:class I SAM-dependent methyltransferase [Methylobacteriaceae bacterium]